MSSTTKKLKRTPKWLGATGDIWLTTETSNDFVFKTYHDENGFIIESLVKLKNPTKERVNAANQAAKELIKEIATAQ